MMLETLCSVASRCTGCEETRKKGKKEECRAVVPVRGEVVGVGGGTIG